jgi:hypothetical protein
LSISFPDILRVKVSQSELSFHLVYSIGFDIIGIIGNDCNGSIKAIFKLGRIYALRFSPWEISIFKHFPNKQFQKLILDGVARAAA